MLLPTCSLPQSTRYSGHFHHLPPLTLRRPSFAVTIRLHNGSLSYWYVPGPFCLNPAATDHRHSSNETQGRCRSRASESHDIHCSSNGWGCSRLTTSHTGTNLTFCWWFYNRSVKVRHGPSTGHDSCKSKRIQSWIGSYSRQARTPCWLCGASGTSRVGDDLKMNLMITNKVRVLKLGDLIIEDKLALDLEF